MRGYGTKWLKQHAPFSMMPTEIEGAYIVIDKNGDQPSLRVYTKAEANDLVTRRNEYAAEAIMTEGTKADRYEY